MSMLGRQSPDPRDERLGGSRTGPARKEENVYIPHFITKRPFYAIDESEENSAAGAADEGSAAAAAGATRVGSRDYLDHQRAQKHKSSKTAVDDGKWYQRGKTLGPAATKYRKGACENCGSMSHKRRDCFSRPRAKLAKYTNADIQPDEVVEDVNLSWDAKRDRWIGFDPRDYATMMAQRQKMNEAKRVLQEKMGTDEDNTKKEEETRYAEDADMGISRKNGAADLRIREDTARYLVNLDVDSAKYDPKRRKIVDGGAFVDDSARLFAEQNFAQASGDAEAFERAERYAWEVHDKTGDASLHLQANPTAAEHRRKQDLEEARRKQKELDEIMLKKYGVTASGGELIGGGETTDQSSAAKTKKTALLATAVKSSEHFIEYDEAGHVKDKFQAKRADRSKYPEDVFPLNHTAVWGSWWHNFQWGYACCHSFVRNSYCTGEEGRLAWERAERQRLGDWGDDDGRDISKDDDDDYDDGADETRGEPKRLTAHGEEEQDAPSEDDGRRRRGSLRPRTKKTTERRSESED